MKQNNQDADANSRRVILVPLDESRRAEIALGLASQIARSSNATLVLLTVPLLHEDPLAPEIKAISYEAAASLQTPTELVESSRADALKYLTTVQARLAANKIEADIRIVNKMPAEAISSVAEEVDAALLVIATHGRSGLTRWALGSVADKVLQTAPSPILITRQGSNWNVVGPQNILVALDGSALAEEVLPEVEWIASAFGADITLAHVLPTLDHCIDEDPAGSKSQEAAQLYLDQQAEALRGHGFTVHSEIVSAGNVAEALLDLDAEETIDLLAMTTHGRGGIKRWAYGSVADRMIRSATTPILLVRATES